MGHTSDLFFPRAYSKAQLLDIYGTAEKENGLVSLARELITAKLNRRSGAPVPDQVARAISRADALINNLVIPPVGAGFLPASATNSLTKILAKYNKGRIDGAPSCHLRRSDDDDKDDDDKI
jgi:hypothetical protein